MRHIFRDCCLMTSELDVGQIASGNNQATRLRHDRELRLRELFAAFSLPDVLSKVSAFWGEPGAEPLENCPKVSSKAFQGGDKPLEMFSTA